MQVFVFTELRLCPNIVLNSNVWGSHPSDIWRISAGIYDYSIFCCCFVAMFWKILLIILLPYRFFSHSNYAYVHWLTKICLVGIKSKNLNPLAKVFPIRLVRPKIVHNERYILWWILSKKWNWNIKETSSERCYIQPSILLQRTRARGHMNYRVTVFAWLVFPNVQNFNA